MSAPKGPAWKGEKCTSVYVWEDAPLPLPSPSFDSAKQAAQITLMRKRDQKRGSPKELYVCKWYRTSGVKQTGISGPKFIHREWMILSSIRHPSIVAYEDFSYDPNGARLAKLYMEYCPGGDLSRHLKKGSRDDRLHYQEGLQVLEQLTQAILYIHHGISKVGDSIQLASPVPVSLQSTPRDVQAGWVTILHRDIKPANVFVVNRSEIGIVVKLGDFGIAKFETDGTDTYVGSRDFLAPEQRTASRDGRRTTIKSDIYALGVTLKQVTNLDASLDEGPSRHQLPRNQQNALSRLLDRLTHQDDHERPGSGVIIDIIQTSIRPSRSSATMLNGVVHSILNWDVNGLTASGKKRAKQNLKLQLLLCRRLLLAGTSADISSNEKTTLLGLAVAFMNASLDTLETPHGVQAPCSAWKGSIVEELISVLRQHTTSYHSLETELPSSARQERNPDLDDPMVGDDLARESPMPHDSLLIPAEDSGNWLKAHECNCSEYLHQRYTCYHHGCNHFCQSQPALERQEQDFHLARTPVNSGPGAEDESSSADVLSGLQLHQYPAAVSPFLLTYESFKLRHETPNGQPGCAPLPDSDIWIAQGNYASRGQRTVSGFVLETKTRENDVRFLCGKLNQESLGELRESFLPVLGYRQPPYNRPDGAKIFQVVVELPEGLERNSLSHILSMRPPPELQERLEICKNLALATQAVHSIQLVHKALRARSILMLSKPGAPLSTAKAYLQDWNYIREISGATTELGEPQWSKRIYQHPERQGEYAEAAFETRHDIYSLGVCILEILLWKPFVVVESGSPAERLEVCELFEHYGLARKKEDGGLPEKYRIRGGPVKLTSRPWITMTIWQDIAKAELANRDLARLVLQCLQGDFKTAKDVELHIEKLIAA